MTTHNHLLLLVLAFASVCYSQSSPFLTPFTGDTITAGTTYNITWTVILGSFVNIQIKNQYSAISTYFNGSNCPNSLTDFGCSQIATNIENSGIYSWAVPANAPSSGFYTLDLSVSNGGLSGSTDYTTGEFFISQSGSGGTGTLAGATGVAFVTDASSSIVKSTTSVTRRVVHTAVATTTSLGASAISTSKSSELPFLISRDSNSNI
jgi:hypothetical protein